MTEQTQHSTTEPGAVPVRIELEDFIEAIARGVARALAAQDEVSGYALADPSIGGYVCNGIFSGLTKPSTGRPLIIELERR